MLRTLPVMVTRGLILHVTGMVFTMKDPPHTEGKDAISQMIGPSYIVYE